MANWLTRTFQSLTRATEGAYRPGPYLLSDGWLSASAGRYINWWQNGHDLQPYGECSAMVEACVAAYSQTVAMCPGDHWRKLENGGRERVMGSSLSRVIRRPNDYQSISDFLLNLTRRLYTHGEAFALATRNNRGEIAELHGMRSGCALIAEDGTVFYDLSGNEVIERRFDLTGAVPARDVLHVRLHTPRHALKGVSPILSTLLDRQLAGAALSQQVAFYVNQARPSFLLETDQQLSTEQALELRESWERQTQGNNAGGTPILSWGLKAKPVTTNASDGMLADLLRMSEQNVALAFRLPLAVLGIGAGGSVPSTETLMQQWIASGLGFCLNHVEESFGLLFGLRGMPDEYLEFDTHALLRSAYRDRMEALARGVISGIYAPDEARAREDLPAVPGGHGAMPRVQQQVVPLSYGTDMRPPPLPAQGLPVPPDEDADAPADRGAEWGAITAADIRGAVAEAERRVAA